MSALLQRRRALASCSVAGEGRKSGLRSGLILGVEVLPHEPESEQDGEDKEAEAEDVDTGIGGVGRENDADEAEERRDGTSDPAAHDDLPREEEGCDTST